jgi:hypothetical protein
MACNGPPDPWRAADGGGIATPIYDGLLREMAEREHEPGVPPSTVILESSSGCPACDVDEAAPGFDTKVPPDILEHA